MAATEHHTFLFADISGYSQLTEQHGDEAAAEVAIRFGDEVKRIAARHEAEVVKCVGDAVMVRTSCAAGAIELALQLQRALDASPGLPEVHIGIHTGPAVERAGDWWGATVNVASRVADTAEAGQLLITEATRRAAGDCSTRLRALGPVRFRNISSPVSVYAAGADDGIESLGYRRRPQALGRTTFQPQPLAARA